MESNLSVPPKDSASSQRTPRILARPEHPISRKQMAPEALKVLRRLSELGFKAYLVGGAVRDLYLGKTPKDYDIGTDARPSRLKKIFPTCRIIGRRFRIAHVHFPSGRIIEVATFRKNSPKIVRTESGVILRDNEYGSPEEDAVRRDLTINGLFYDIATFSVIDYVGGVEDLERGIIRTIAPPDESFREDPVRMIRALRHAARTGFQIEDETLAAIYRHARDITLANPARLLEEILKDLRSGAAAPFFRSTLETHILDALCPELARQLRHVGPDHPFWARMEALDRRTREGEVFDNAILLALFLQTVLVASPALWTGYGEHTGDISRMVARGVREMDRGFRISRRDAERIVQLLVGARKLERHLRHGSLPGGVARKSYFADSVSFLMLDFDARGEDMGLLERWREAARKRDGKIEVRTRNPKRSRRDRSGRSRSRRRSR